MKNGARPLRTTRRMQNLRQTRPGWYKITNGAKGKPALVSIYDEIGFLGVSAGDFMAELRSISGDIEMHVNSPGGDVFDGIAIYNQLRQRQGSVHVVVDGLAASAASFIVQAASPGRLEMAPHSQMMIHDGFAMAIGNAADMRETADLLDKASNEIASIYAERTGKPVEHWRGQMRGEKWFSDQEAVDAGLADRIHGRAASGDAQDAWDLSVFAHYAGVRNKLGNAATPHAPMKGTHSHPHPAYGSQGADASHDHEHSHDGDAAHSHSHAAAAEPAASKARKPRKGKKGKGKKPFPGAAPPFTKEDNPGNCCRSCNITYLAGTDFCGSCGKRLSMADSSGWVQDPDGGWRFDPDGDGDDDSTPEGDSDHDYWTADGTQLLPIPPNPGKVGDLLVRTIRNIDVDSSPWDASKAWHNGAESDDPAAFYKGICAGRKAGDPATQDAWALPYKYTPGSAVNAAAVRAGLSRISQTQGLTNKAEAQALLEKLMKQINPDYNADDRIETGLLAAALLTGLEGAFR